MPWTLILRAGDSYTVATEVLSFDPTTAWDQAKEKYHGLIGMLKGQHASVWVSHE